MGIKSSDFGGVELTGFDSRMFRKQALGEEMTQHEYDFLTSRWDKNNSPVLKRKVFEFCRSFGWCAGLDYKGRPILTNKGIKAIKAYQAEDNYKRIDVI